VRGIIRLSSARSSISGKPMGVKLIDVQGDYDPRRHALLIALLETIGEMMARSYAARPACRLSAGQPDVTIVVPVVADSAPTQNVWTSPRIVRSVLASPLVRASPLDTAGDDCVSHPPFDREGSMSTEFCDGGEGLST
jgi:hypothetical protein